MSTDNMTGIAAQTYIRIYQSACRMMEKLHPYTDPGFDLVLLARLIGTNRTQLSTAINQQAKTSFSNWLALYRINFVTGQLKLRPDTPVDELYPAAGFTARSTFYRQFRQVTGFTPKQFLSNTHQ